MTVRQTARPAAETATIASTATQFTLYEYTGAQRLPPHHTGQDQEYGLVSVFKKITRLVGRLVPVFFRGNLQGDLSREIDYTPPVADPRKHAPRRRETSY